MSKFLNIALISLLVVLAIACKREDPAWNSDLSAPLLKGQLTIYDLISDSLIVANSDSSVTFVYNKKIYSAGLDTLLQIPDTTLPKTVTLSSISLGTRVISQDITLGQVARGAGPPFGSVILSSHGQNFVLPPFDNLSAGAVEVDANSLFQTATFKSGNLELKIKNGFPVDIEEVHLTLSNKTSGTIVIQDTIPLIVSGQEFVENYPLAGKTVEGTLIAAITNINSPGSNGNPVPIDTNDALEITLTASALQVQSATAIFPAQNLVDTKEDIAYDIPDAELTSMILAEGTIKMTVASTIQDSVYINYEIPEAKKGGRSLVIRRVIPPAPAGDTVYLSEDVDVRGYRVDLRGQDGTKYNTFYNTFVVSIDSTGKLASLSLDDSIYVFYGLVNVVPEYVEGYLGQKQFEVGPEQIKFDFFDQVASGQLEFEDVHMELQFDNTVGADGEIQVNTVSFQNPPSTSLLQSPLLESPINIPRATDGPLEAGNKTLELSKSNSNLPEALKIIPKEVTYSLDVELNPNGNVSGHKDFLYRTSEIAVIMGLQIPLDYSATRLTLQDTLELNLTEEEAIGNIQEATLNLEAENMFPMDIGLTFYLLESFTGQVIDSIFTAPGNVINAATNFQPDGKIRNPVQTMVQAKLDQAQIMNLQRSDKVLVKAILHTPFSNKVKVYDHYTLDMILTTDFTYRIVNK
ncbi:MAG: hypothetical protein WD077_05675 [Bacteroidia bacterium]